MDATLERRDEADGGCEGADGGALEADPSSITKSDA
jgi:hypothetical protein